MTREETLQRIEDLKKELNQLELTAYKYDNYVVMAIKIKGKETLQIHPKKTNAKPLSKRVEGCRYQRH